MLSGIRAVPKPMSEAAAKTTSASGSAVGSGFEPQPNVTTTRSDVMRNESEWFIFKISAYVEPGVSELRGVTAESDQCL